MRRAAVQAVAGTDGATTAREDVSEPFYRISADAALERLRTDRAQGLTDGEVSARRRRHGRNVLSGAARPAPYLLFLRQFKDLIIGVLLVAAALALYLEDYRGSTILFAIIVINAAIGAYQEYRAERTLDMLKMLIKARATVVREGGLREIDADDLVPGDIVMLEEGSAVPADIRLIESTGFSTNDFILTGESLPQDKSAEVVIAGEASLSEQDNLVFFGTTVARGNALGVVFNTGMSTAIGNIAQLSETIERDRSPLQQEIDTLAKTLTKLAGVVALVLFAANVLLRGHEFESLELLINGSVLFAITVAAACVPQGLPAQISVALSLGVGRLARKRAVVKRLSAVETLGSTTVICSDKTGTITSNEMTITACWANGRALEVTGAGYDPEGEIRVDGRRLTPQELEPLKQFFEDGFLAGTGRTHPPDEAHRTWYVIGDPTGAAFMPLAVKAGLDPDDLEARFPVIHEVPFDSERKRMTIVREHKGRVIGYMKGALETVLDACGSFHRNGKVLPLSEAEREAAAAQGREFSGRSLRVIALAYRDFPAGQSEFDPAATETDFVFAGLVAMIDLPRPGVEEAVRSVSAAQVRMFMITGDDPVTAKAIAERIGMEEGPVLTGVDVRKMPEQELKKLLLSRSLIFSRVSPQDKYRIVRVLKQMGEVVAVTGDGVNDTLSLKQADIGVAMGKLGSDVAKEAAEIVLIDDNFSTLVMAIREGRTIFQNLKRVILSSITSNLGELSCVCFGFAGVALGLPIPLTAVQILAVDLIAEMLPLMALTFDRPESTVMTAPPRKLDAHIVNRRSLTDLFFQGILMGAAAYFSFLMVQRSGGSIGMSQGAAYVSIALVQYTNILSRRTSRSIFGAYLFTNRHLWYALTVSLVMVLLIVNVGAIGIWFGFEPMRPADWLWPLGGALAFLAVVEAKKLVVNRGSPARP